MREGIKRYRNVNYSRLAEQVRLEHTVSNQRNSSLDCLTTCLADSLFDDHTLEFTCISTLRKEEFQTPVISNAVEFALMQWISQKRNIALDLPDTLDTTYILNSIIESSAFASSAKSLILYLYKDNSAYKEPNERLNRQLLSESKAAIESRTFSRIPDLLLGCKSSDALSQEVLNVIANDFASEWSKEKIAKLILFLKSNGIDSHLDHFLNLLEEKIEEDFSHSIQPDIWFSIIESEKLINSNIAIDELKVLLANLHGSNVKWSQVIDNISENGVFINLNTFAGNMSFSISEDVFSFMALRDSGREFALRIDSSHLERIQNLSNAGSDSLNRKGVVVFVALNIVSIIALVRLNLDKSLFRELNILLTSNLSPSTVKEFLFQLFQTPLLTVLLILWNINMWRHLTTNKTLTWRNAILSIPLIKKLQNLFE